MKKTILLIFFLINSIFAQNTPTGNLEGLVADASNKNSLIGVNIFILNKNSGTTSNEKGNYIFNDLPVGTYTIQFSYIGYEKVTKTDVIIRSKRTTYLNIEMLPSSVELNDVVVESGYFTEINDKPLGTANFSSEEIRRAPGSAGDVSRILFGLPSLAKVNDARNSLIVRGGSPIENSFYIDNIEIPNINHFPVEGSSDGPIGILNADFIEDVNFYSGGFSPIYGERLSSIMEISFREGSKDQFNSQLNLSMQGVGAAIEGPLSDCGSYMASGSIAYLDLILDESETGGAIPHYGDGQTKIVYNLNDNNKLTLLEVFSWDQINLDYENAVKTDLTNIYGKTDGITNVAGLNWQFLWGKKGYSNTSISHTYFGYKRNYSETKSKKHLLENNSKEYNLKLRNVNFYKMDKSNSFEFGFEGIYNFSNFDVFYNTWEDHYGNPTPQLFVENKLNTSKLAIFAQHKMQLFNQCNLEYGGRIDYFQFNDHLNFSPRLSLSYELKNGITVSGSAGIFTQEIPVNFLIQNDNFKDLKTPTSNHFILGISKMLGESTRLSLEGYYKTYQNFPINPAQPNVFIFDQSMIDGVFLNHESLVDDGEAFSRGIELMIQKKLASDFYGMASTSYSKTRYKDLNGDWHDRIYDNVFNFNIEGGYIPNDEWEFKLRWIYAGGSPYTPFDIEKSTELNRGIWDLENINGKRLPDYHSLNIRVDKRFYFSSSSLIVYLSVWNAYGRENIAFYQWDEQKNTLGYQKQWSTMPVLGLDYKF
ncbi:MAG: carboxypeptidase-like regulatory domain-containing protein [Ignavibacteriae bacterium]|nr:carboxypeptidase-like regulatory domain-containing protein [Ignavibacteriota bacterium]MCB9259153.1 carboxypeptidase-like regulatory domain-containing protein [Ignavibacteriales bacterium]